MIKELKARIAQISAGTTPNGYKKTKVGILPVEWKTVRLKTISKHSTEKNKDLKYHETYTNSATQGIIKQTDYFDKQISNNENIDGYYIVRQNDYVYNPRISVSAPCGPISKSHFVETGVMSPLYTVFRLNDEYEDNGYIEHYFKSPFWYRYMSSVANYGARHDRMNITNDDLFNMPIPIPPLPEQQKIAEILSTQDKLIELQEKKIEQLKELKKAYLQKMFPKKGSKYPELRFKGFTDAWEQRVFGDLAEYKKGPFGSAITKDMFVPKSDLSVKVYEQQNAINKDWTLERYFLPKEYVITKLKSFEVHGGDIIVSCAGTIGEIYEIPINAECGIINQALMRVRVNEDVVGKKLFTIVFSNMIEAFSSIHSNGSAIKNIPPFADLKPMEVLIPSIEEQKKIENYFCNLDTLITLHQRKSEQEKQKKKALMQLLLTGIVRTK